MPPTAFLGAYAGTGAFWNATTRLLDGFELLGAPETGHQRGPRARPARARSPSATCICASTWCCPRRRATPGARPRRHPKGRRLMGARRLGETRRRLAIVQRPAARAGPRQWRTPSPPSPFDARFRACARTSGDPSDARHGAVCRLDADPTRARPPGRRPGSTRRSARRPCGLSTRRARTGGSSRSRRPRRSPTRPASTWSRWPPRRARPSAGSWTTASGATSRSRRPSRPAGTRARSPSRRSSSGPRSTRTTTPPRRGTSSGSCATGTRSRSRSCSGAVSCCTPSAARRSCCGWPMS